MKAISTVIASILMLMIVVGLGGTAYLFISGTFTSKTAATLEVIDAVSDTVIVRNSGTDPIMAFTSANIDGNPAVYRVLKEDSSLVAYWKMDESWINDCSTATVIDSSRNGYHGKSCPASTGPTGGASGRFGNAGSFDGANDYVLIGNAPSSQINGHSALTVEAWVKPTNLAGDKDIVTQNVPFHFLLTGDKLQIRLNAGGWVYLAGTISLTADFHHVAMVYDGSNMKLYVDGKFDTQQGESDILSDGNCMTIGAWNSGGCGGISERFNGLIDEVKIYNRALSEQEIKASYNIGSQINPGEIATIKIYNQLSKGTHTLRLCTGGSCNTAILTII